MKEFYSNANVAEETPDITTMNGDEDNDAILNNGMDDVLINGGDGDDNIDNYNSSNVTINGDSGSDLIGNLNSNNVSINGGTGNDIISNYSDNVTINTGEGDNFIKNVNPDAENQTIQTGAGADIFLYNEGEGKDVIENFGEGDKISLNGAEIKDTKIKGKNSIIKFKGGSLTVKNTSDFTFTHDGTEKNLARAFSSKMILPKFTAPSKAQSTLTNTALIILTARRAKRNSQSPAPIQLTRLLVARAKIKFMAAPAPTR